MTLNHCQEQSTYVYFYTICLFKLFFFISNLFHFIFVDLVKNNFIFGYFTYHIFTRDEKEIYSKKIQLYKSTHTYSFIYENILLLNLSQLCRLNGNYLFKQNVKRMSVNAFSPFCLYKILIILLFKTFRPLIISTFSLIFSRLS